MVGDFAFQLIDRLIENLKKIHLLLENFRKIKTLFYSSNTITESLLVEITNFSALFGAIDERNLLIIPSAPEKTRSEGKEVADIARYFRATLDNLELRK